MKQYLFVLLMALAGSIHAESTTVRIVDGGVVSLSIGGDWYQCSDIYMAWKNNSQLRSEIEREALVMADAKPLEIGQFVLPLLVKLNVGVSDQLTSKVNDAVTVENARVEAERKAKTDAWIDQPIK